MVEGPMNRPILKGFTDGEDGDTVTEMSMMLLKARGGICVDMILLFFYREVGRQSGVRIELDLHAGRDGVLNCLYDGLIKVAVEVCMVEPLKVVLDWYAHHLRCAVY